MTGRNGFGSIRLLASGRFQARYIGPDGLRRTAPVTFDSKGAARRWLSMCETDILRGTWTDVEAASERLGPYAAKWIRERPNLAARTVEGYEGTLRRHVEPYLGSKEIRQITPAVVRAWRQRLLHDGVGANSVAKAYRLLRAVMNTALDDQLIARNPCRIKGAATETPEERPVLTVAQVQRLAGAIEPRYRLLVLLAVYASLRWGEIIGLQRGDFNLAEGTVRVRRAVAEMNGRLFIKTPKTAAGTRTVAYPMWLVPEIERHLEAYADPGPEAYLFLVRGDTWPRRGNFSRLWQRILADVGLSGIRLHDLRHTGNHLAAATGASTRELMGRMGHASVRAALIYQHRTADRDRKIADALEGPDDSGHDL